MKHVKRMRLSAFLDGEAPEEERAEISKHLRDCSGCRLFLAVLAGRDMGGALHKTGMKEEGQVSDRNLWLLFGGRSKVSKEASLNVGSERRC